MKLNEILGIEYPFIQGGMANIATGEFAAAVSAAGGLGLTDKPFGVNIMLMHPQADEIADIVIQENVKIVTTGAGNPASYIDGWKKAGIKIFPVVPSVGLARRMEKYGADGVIAEGTESGGHVGELTTMALVPQVAGAVSIPVIAAGGIASGKQILAAAALGVYDGDIKTGSLMAGQVCGMINSIRPVRRILEDLYSEYEEELKRVVADRL